MKNAWLQLPVSICMAIGYTVMAAAAPAPAILSFSPLTGPVGSIVLVTGNDFNPVPGNNIVYFGATRATVTAATITSLAVTVPAGATYRPITVLDSITGLSGASILSFGVTFPGGTMTFAPSGNFATGFEGRGLASGDIDNDGKPDLVATTIASGAVLLLKNASSPASISFDAAQTINAGSGVYGVTIADIDGDGKNDIAATGWTGSNVALIRNTSALGITSFAPGYTKQGSSGPQTISVVDLDGDGKPEVVSGATSAGAIDIYQNLSGAGTLTFANNFSFFTNRPESLITPDITGDGKPDLVVTNGAQNGMHVFVNTSTAGHLEFSGANVFAAGNYTYGVASGDLDGDGRIDLAVTNRDDATVSVFLNRGGAGVAAFAPPQQFAVGQMPYMADIGDVDGDGKPDIVVGNYGSGTISILRNNSTPGSLVLQSKQDLVTAARTYNVLISDMDGDSRPEIIAVNAGANSVSVFRNTQTALPVWGLTLEAAKKINGVQLNWNTQRELHSDHFDVEKSTNGSDYTLLGIVAASGTTSQLTHYRFEDTRPASGLNYYRLVETGIDGNRKYSPVITVDWIEAGELTVALSPQPMKTNMNVTVNGIKGKAHFLLYSAGGKLLKRYPLNAAENFFQLNRSNLNPGVYFYTVKCEGLPMRSGRIVVQ